MVALGLLLLLVVLGVASLTGRTADSRDPDFTLGAVTHRRAEAAPDADETTMRTGTHCPRRLA